MQELATKIIIRQGRRAVINTVFNTFICAADIFLGVGIGAPFIGSLTKVIKRFDLTPDVPKKFVWGFFGVEIPLGLLPLPFSFPSYFVPAVWQLWKDWPKLRAYWQRRRQQKMLR